MQSLGCWKERQVPLVDANKLQNQMYPKHTYRHAVHLSYAPKPISCYPSRPTLISKTLFSQENQIIISPAPLCPSKRVVTNGASQTPQATVLLLQP